MSCSFDKCCTEKLSPMTVGERLPVFLDVSEFLESVDSQSVSCATVCIKQASSASLCGAEPDPDAEPSADILKATEPEYNGHDRFIKFNLYDGEGGVGYQVDVCITTCEGHITKFCFQQHMIDCGC